MVTWIQLSMWFSTISKILWLVGYGHTHMRCVGIQDQRDIYRLEAVLTLWHPRFWFWEFFAIKAGGWICKKIVLGDVESMRYATLHSWGLALVQYTRSKIEDISIPNINYCKIMLCYWLVLSTYYVDFLKYFTSFNKSFDNSLFSYIPLKRINFLHKFKK